MTSKQKNSILCLLSLDPEGFKPVEVQKFMFLYAQEFAKEHVYEFMPCSYGCYSSTLRKDMERLQEMRLIKEVNKKWMLTNEGQFEVVTIPATMRRFRDMSRRYTMRGDDLIAEVYRRYPYCAINSKIKEERLKGDRAALKAIEEARPTKKTPLASIGYEGRSLENYGNALIANGITVLCDVRKNPISRKYGFSRSTLENACKDIHIEYRHYPELGVPSYERQDLSCQADYDDLFERYEEKILPKQSNLIDALANLVALDVGVAFTCFESNPAQCHRTRVINAITRKTGVEAELI